MKKPHTAQQGMVLIMTLFFLQLLNILALYALQNHGLSQRLVQDIQHKNQILQLAKSVLFTAERKLQQQIPLCQIAIMSAHDLQNKPLTWWQNQACFEENDAYQFYYVVEFLGDDSCAILGKTGLNASYYRLSLFVNEKDPRQKTLIQSTIVKSTRSAILCQHVFHQVTIGRQAFHQLQ